MNPKTLILAVPLMALAAAAGAREVDVAALADRTGLTENQVRMVLGAPSAYAEYRTSYWIAEHRVMAALSDPNYYYEDDADAAPARVIRDEDAYDDDEVEDANADAVTEPLDEPEPQLQVQDVDPDDD